MKIYDFMAEHQIPLTVNNMLYTYALEMMGWKSYKIK